MDHLGRSLAVLDDKQAAAIERRRKMEEERKARIFNEKTRTKGVDLEGIEEQLRIKKELKDQELQREREISSELLNIDQQLQILAARHEEARKQVAIQNKNDNVNLATMKRNTYTPPSRDFTDMEPSRLGSASMLRFSGEDPNAKVRTKKQHEQISEWADRDARLKQERAKADREATLLYERQVLAMQQRALELQKEHESVKASIRVADKDTNRQLAAGKYERERQHHVDDTNAKIDEITYQLNSDLLTEKGNTTSSISSTRVIPYAFKGMSPEQKRGITNEQERQRKEKEEKRRMKEEEERKWAAQQDAFQRTALLREREVQRQKEALAKQMQDEQLRLAREKKERYDNLHKNVYTNQPTEGYFSQFGTSSR